MGRPAWLTISPTEGSGNATINNTAMEHTGRIARTGIVKVVPVGQTFDPDKHQYTVRQTPKAEFVAFVNGSEMAADKAGGPVTITGKSNSNALTFTTTASDVTLPGTYTAAGLTTANGAEIADDPGAVAEFDFAITLTLPPNESVSEIERTFNVKASGGQVAQIVVKQSAGDAYLEVTPREITIPQAGGSVSVSVTSNTTWTVE